MEALEPTGTRFERALERFLAGRSMCLQGVNFWLAPDGYLEVRVHPDWRVNRNEEQEAMDELGFSRCVAEEISSRSPRFSSAVDGLPWRLVKLDPSGTRVVRMYCPEESKIIWSPGVG